jgi:DNA topoisomerase-1
MKEASYTAFSIIISNGDLQEYKFKTTKKFLTSVGYLIVYNKTTEDYNNFINNLKNVKLKELSFLANINKPKTLYNEVALIKKLENAGIGRPSTYASIIEKLFNRKYVIKGNNPNSEVKLKDYIKKNNKEIIIKDKIINTGGKQKDLLVPTELGINCINYLNNITPFLLNVDFTSDMELALDKISLGTLTKNQTLSEFNNKLIPIIEKYCTKKNFKKNMVTVTIINQKIDI